MLNLSRGDSYLLIFPDGKICASRQGVHWLDDPCYGVGRNQRETIERMRAYEERNRFEFRAELIGEV